MRADPSSFGRERRPRWAELQCSAENTCAEGRRTGRSEFDGSYTAAADPLPGGVIGSTPDSGSGSWGSSPCPAVLRSNGPESGPLFVAGSNPLRASARPLRSSPVLLTITTTHRPATDLGFLLHKHPERVQAFSLPFGHGPRLLPRGERGALHGGAADGRRPGRAGPRRGRGGVRAGRVRQRPAVRGVVAALASRSCTVFKTAMEGKTAGARRRRRSRSRPRLPRAVPRRRGARPAAVRAARLRGRRPSRSTRSSGARAATSR